MAARTYPLPKPAKVIGTPYSGTHGASAPQNWESRNAVDLATPVGTPIYAQSAGVIGDQIGPLEGASKTGRFAGLRVHLVTGDNEFYYAHLSKLVVKAGEHVTDGQLLGYSGEANGVAHLHFAAKNGDPESILSQAAAPDPASAPVGSSSAPTAGSAGAAAPSSDTSQVGDQFTAPLPIGSGVSQPQAYDPGTVPADAATPHQYAETWQRIAADPWASPDVQAIAGLWQQGG